MYCYRALLRLDLAMPERLREGAVVELFGQPWSVLEILEDASEAQPGCAVLGPEGEPGEVATEATVEGIFPPRA